jgi:hypothetical protein
LLGVYELGEGGDAIVGEEMMVGCGVETWTGAADVVRPWSFVFVGSIAL